PYDLVCFDSWCLAVSDRSRGRGPKWIRPWVSGLCWNDRRDLFWNLSHPGIFLSDHEDFCSAAQQEAAKLYLPLSTVEQSRSPPHRKIWRHRSQSVEKAHFWRNLLSFRRFSTREIAPV